MTETPTVRDGRDNGSAATGPTGRTRKRCPFGSPTVSAAAGAAGF